MPMRRAKRQGEMVGGDDSAREAVADPRVEKLQQAFLRFRSTHQPRARYPESLRAAVMAALDGGAAELEVRRACKITAEQLAVWRRRRSRALASAEPAQQEARVFSVVDDAGDAEGDEMELRIGGWSVRIRRADGGVAQ